MDPKTQFSARIQNLIDSEKAKTCGEDASRIYAERQKKRFELTLKICRKHLPEKESHVLDIGRSNLTRMLSQFYSHVTSMGFDLKHDDGGHRETATIDSVKHIVYDLNNSREVNSWPELPDHFNLVTICETIEHLSTPPEFTLFMLKYLLKPNGYLIVTTPNAVSIHKRLLFLYGKNPFERIRYFSPNPGDFRQYTTDELTDMGDTCGLKVVLCKTVNFRRSRHAVLRLAMNLPQFRDSVVAVFSK